MKEMRSQPWLSVIIPTYNGGKYLTRCLNSLITQDDLTFECLALDDGSTDSTVEILHSYTSQLPLRILKNPRTGNWAANTNTVLAEATGDYVCFLHQDDFWLPNRLHLVHRLLRQFPDVDFLLSPAVFVDSDGHEVGKWGCPFPKVAGYLTKQNLLSRLLVQNFLAIPAPVVRRELLNRLGGLNEVLWYTSDWDLWLKIAESARSCYTPVPTVAFRVHPDSQTIQRSTDAADFRQQLDAVLEQHIIHLSGDERLKAHIRQCGQFSNKVNSGLANFIHSKKKIILIDLLFSFLTLGPTKWATYCRSSRIVERVLARLRSKANQGAL